MNQLSNVEKSLLDKEVTSILSNRSVGRMVCGFIWSFEPLYKKFRNNTRKWYAIDYIYKNISVENVTYGGKAFHVAYNKAKDLPLNKWKVFLNTFFNEEEKG